MNDKALPWLKVLFRWPVHWLTPWWPSCVSYHKKFCTFCYWSSTEVVVVAFVTPAKTRKVCSRLSLTDSTPPLSKTVVVTVFENCLAVFWRKNDLARHDFSLGLCSQQIAPFMQYPILVLLGKTCEINVNECMSNPCQNNATCIDDVNGYMCECLQGFRGK